MFELILKYSAVYLSSMFKFVLGPLAGTVSQLSIAETSVFSVLGMMSTVILMMLIGVNSRQWILRNLRLEKMINSSSERFGSLWEKYGVHGVAFLTPVLFTPVGGSFIAIMMGGSRKKIVKAMLVSAIFWGLTISIVFERLGTAMFGL